MMRDVLTWSFPIGQLFGITIRVHFAMPIFVLGMVGRQAMDKDAPLGAWQDAAWLMAFLFVSVLLHEFGHCFAARFMDGESDEVLLWPLGGLAFCRSLPNTALAHFVFALGKFPGMKIERPCAAISAQSRYSPSASWMHTMPYSLSTSPQVCCLFR